MIDLKHVPPIFLFLLILANALAPARGQTGLLVSNVSGSVQIRRHGWQKFEPLHRLCTINSTDQIKWRSAGEISGCCLSTGRFETLKSPASNFVCGSAQSVMVDGYAFDPPRGDDTDSSVPILLTPRAGKVLSLTPLITWKRVYGVSQYTVSLLGSDWSVTTDQTTLRYPLTAPRLRRGVHYTFIVAANGVLSVQDSHGGQGFIATSLRESESVTKELARIRRLPLDRQSSLESQVIVLLRDQCDSDAATLFNGVAESHSADSCDLIGSMDVELGLPRDAEQVFLEGISIARNTQDREECAVLQRKVAAVYRSIGIDPAAKNMLIAAREFYTEVGDSKTVEQLNSTIAEIDQSN